MELKIREISYTAKDTMGDQIGALEISFTGNRPRIEIRDEINSCASFTFEDFDSIIEIYQKIKKEFNQ